MMNWSTVGSVYHDGVDERATNTSRSDFRGYDWECTRVTYRSGRQADYGPPPVTPVLHVVLLRKPLFDCDGNDGFNVVVQDSLHHVNKKGEHVGDVLFLLRKCWKRNGCGRKTGPAQHKIVDRNTTSWQNILHGQSDGLLLGEKREPGDAFGLHRGTYLFHVTLLPKS